MPAELHVKPEVFPIEWEEFVTTHPPNSIALDGYVIGEPRFEANGPFLNANHHERVNRLATLATSQQILMSLRMGLDQSFQRDGEFAPEVFVNDCDQDVCAAWYLLKHIDQAKNPANPALNRFIHIAGTLDATAGAYPYDRGLEILSKLAWVFEPYGEFRASGEMAKKDACQYRSVIESVGLRIQQHLMGDGGRIALDTRYKEIGGGQGWKMIEEIGKDGRIGALYDGINAYILAQQTADDQWRYTIGRRSEFIPFDIPGIIGLLNSIEECDEDRWGGADTIGGSPRVGGSKLSPSEVEAVINTYIASSRSQN